MRKLICGVLASTLLLCGCADNKEVNYLGGKGKILHAEGAMSRGVVYDDVNIYFNIDEVYRLEKNGELLINCDIATCKHDTKKCKAASRDGEYFVVDTNSTNHTYLNGGMLQSNVETKIAHGAQIRLANEDFEFKLY